MRNLILAGALALLALSPMTAAAQQRVAPAPAAPAPVAPAPAAPAPTASAAAAEGVTSGKILAIGIGALVGAVAGQAIVAGEGVTLVGGVAGGLLAAWWYDNPNASLTRAAMREQRGTPGLASTERLASNW